MADDPPRGESYEAEHVHAVYEQIAPHFSSTRYKPWPIVTSFLSSLSSGAIGLDVGCGNGKNLSTTIASPAPSTTRSIPSSSSFSSGTFTLGSDRSPALIRLAAQHQQHRSGADVVVADALALPHPSGRFDFAICVAVLHHFSTGERRVEGVRGVLEVLRPRRRGDGAGEPGDSGGRALFTVWALEQQGSRRGWDAGCEQDVMVPWVMKSGAGAGKVRKEDRRKKAKERPSAEGTAAVVGDSEDGAAEKREGLGEEEEGPPAEEQEKTFHRYYHLYKKGELEHDIVEAGGVVLESGYEKDNWWAVAARQAT
ncbi:tRNA methyltransferase, has a role in tRNA modification [Coniosporium apollinis]|uniref:tRNA methyltransferase, has a role in tRNA modification n=1 Tax=Coniosporium apollinis TaxID=61459 RepID=A0ABQ9NVI0_9PEZI|nr:tRNA methyltransferase, has a role in tRNA modification [Coniosporium apollinis]